MRFHYKDFKLAKPYTTRVVFDRNEEEGIDYIKASADMFKKEVHEWFLLEEFE